VAPSSVDPRTPVLVGVGEAHRPVDGSGAVEPLELMVEAAQAAAADAGAPSLLASVAMLAVPEGTWSYPDPGRLVAGRVGATGARTVRADVGVPQTAPVAVALDRIRRGELDVALVVGAEAMASATAAQRAGGSVPETAQEGATPDERWSPQGEIMADAEVQAGMWAPVDQYACIENALGHAEGQPFDEQLDDIAALWASFNAVATTNPLAAFGEPRTAAQLRVAGPGNRPLASPYAKWHVSQWSVDQAAALLLCSAGQAEAAGVPRDRWLFPHACVESEHMASLSRRAELHRWPAMGILGDAVAAHLGRPLREIEVQELYSCFPVAVRVQQRELHLDPGAPATVTGGMTFAGGPLNNFTYQATVEVAQRLRAAPDALGMVTTVSGLLTKPGITVWGAQPAPELLVADFGAEAAAATATLEVTNSATASAVVATSTATYEDGEPSRAFVIADLPDGRRWVGTCHDAGLVQAAARREVIGTTVEVRGTECGPV
jgi:acetyl-CoA C-acetyltransferase